MLEGMLDVKSADNNPPGDEVQDLAREIVAYLQQRRRVADTLEGISHWWIARQRLQEAEHKVREAVDYLCRQGVLERRVSADGRVIYSASQAGADDSDGV